MTRNFRRNIGPLHKAARAGHIEVVKEHLAAGEDVNARDSGLTPLHFAAGGGYKEVVELLIAKGASVNARSYCLTYGAVQYGLKETAELLIAKGANVNEVIMSGKFRGYTPLDSAYRQPETADLLRKHGGKTGAELEAEGN